MKVFWLAFGLFLFATTAFGAESPTQAYLNERDKSVAIATNLDDTVLGSRNSATKEAVTAARATLDDMLKKLEGMLRDLIGPLDLAGFPEQGASNITSLEHDIDFGKLDGIQATSLDGKTNVIVSTTPLLRAWLKDTSGVPADLKAAFESEDFYTYAFNTNFHFYKYADVPVITSARDDIAGAILLLQSMDNVAPYPPSQIAVSVTRGDRVFVFAEDIKQPIDTMPVCKTPLEKEIQAAGKGDASQPATWDSAQLRAWEAAQVPFMQCFAQHVASQDYYPALVKQAQALVDRVESQAADGHAKTIRNKDAD